LREVRGAPDARCRYVALIERAHGERDVICLAGAHFTDRQDLPFDAVQYRRPSIHHLNERAAMARAQDAEARKESAPALMRARLLC